LRTARDGERRASRHRDRAGGCDLHIDLTPQEWFVVRLFGCEVLAVALGGDTGQPDDEPRAETGPRSSASGVWGLSCLAGRARPAPYCRGGSLNSSRRLRAAAACLRICSGHPGSPACPYFRGPIGPRGSDHAPKLRDCAPGHALDRHWARRRAPLRDGPAGRHR
jgi:hypothetical protein